MDEFHPMSFQSNHNRARSDHIYFGLWLNERKAKQTFGINWIPGMNDDVSELDILAFASTNKGCPVLFSVFLCFIIYLNVSRLKRKCYYTYK